ncbi:hypothetical protein [Exiguobacterium artemiae]
MKKRLKVASLFITAGLLAACGNSSNEDTTTAPKKRKRSKHLKRTQMPGSPRRP